jgi:hypothetical protein
VLENVVYNLCPDGSGECATPFIIFVQCMLIIDVFWTFPIIMAPAYDVIEDSLFVDGNHQLEKDLLVEPTTPYALLSLSFFLFFPLFHDFFFELFICLFYLFI